VSGPRDAPPRTRQARLHGAFAHLYPGVPAGPWLHATAVGDMVWALRLERGEGSVHLGERALDPVHFEFRYGETLSAMDRTRRATDRP
jgi:hypothetical protein